MSTPHNSALKKIYKNCDDDGCRNHVQTLDQILTLAKDIGTCKAYDAFSYLNMDPNSEYKDANDEYNRQMSDLYNDNHCFN